MHFEPGEVMWQRPGQTVAEADHGIVRDGRDKVHGYRLVATLYTTMTI